MDDAGRMPRLGRWLLRVMPLGDRRNDVEADLLDLLMQRRVQHGARYATRRFYRDLLSVMMWRRSPQVRRHTGGRRVLIGMAQDLRHAVRLARRRPVLVTTAVLSIALAIGAGTAVFSVLNATFFRWYLAADPAIVQVWRRHANGASRVWPAAEFNELRRHAKTVSLEGFVSANVPLRTLPDVDPEETVAVTFATGRFLDTFGASALAGRLFDMSDDENGATPVVVLDHRYWRHTFGGDAAVIGRTLWLSGSPAIVAGITSRDFDNYPFGPRPTVWAPLAAIERLAPGATRGRITAFGRVAAGSAAPHVDAELTALLTSLAIPPDASVRPATRAESAPAVGAGTVAQARRIVLSVIGIVALLLVLACANISNLLLASAAQRSREIGVRLALGAGRTRVFRQLLIESVLLSGAGAAAGLVLSILIAPALAAFSGLQAWDVARDIEPDARVYLFLVATFVLFSLAAGLAPARFGSRCEVATSLKGTRVPGAALPAPGRMRVVLLGIQACGSIVLIVLASLLVRGVTHVAWRDSGFAAEELLRVTARFPSVRGQVDGSAAESYWAAALDRVRRIPGVEAAGLSMAPPGTTLGNPDQVLVAGVDAEYFRAAGLRTVRGRLYTASEAAARAPLAVVSEQLVRQYWGLDNPLGESLARVDKRLADIRVIGVAGDAFMFGLLARATPIAFLPRVEAAESSMIVRVRDPRASQGSVQQALAALSSEVQSDVFVVSDRFEREMARPRGVAIVATGIASLALVLSLVGLHGVTAFLVRVRTREIGIRLALGARTIDVVRELIGDGMRPVVIGLLAGVLASILAGRVIAGMLYGVSARDPIAIGAGTALLLVTTLIAVAVPARRAARIDPAATLRDSD